MPRPLITPDWAVIATWPDGSMLLRILTMDGIYALQQWIRGNFDAYAIHPNTAAFFVLRNTDGKHVGFKVQLKDIADSCPVPFLKEMYHPLSREESIDVDPDLRGKILWTVYDVLTVRPRDSQPPDPSTGTSWLSEFPKKTGFTVNIDFPFDLKGNKLDSWLDEHVVSGTEVVDTEFMRLMGDNPWFLHPRDMAEMLGNERMRNDLSADPFWAVRFALQDKEGFWEWEKSAQAQVTRNAAAHDPMAAFLYAAVIDESPHEVTRASALQNPLSAYLYDYWQHRDWTSEPPPSPQSHPHDAHRAMAATHPLTALLFAVKVDDDWESPHELLKQGVLHAPFTKPSKRVLDILQFSKSTIGVDVPIRDALTLASGVEQIWSLDRGKLLFHWLRYFTGRVPDPKAPDLFPDHSIPGPIDPEIAAAIVAEGPNDLFQLGKAARKFPELLELGTPELWTTPIVIVRLFGSSQGHPTYVEGVPEKLRAWIKTPRLRRRALSDPMSAYLIAQFVDKRMRLDTLKAASRDNNALKKYIEHFAPDMSRLPGEVRMQMSRKGSDLNYAMGFESHQSRGGTQYTDRHDWVNRTTDQVITEAFRFTARDLRHRYLNKSGTQRNELARATKEMGEWVSSGTSHPPPTSYTSIARRYYPSFLQWTEHDFWQGGDGVSPSSPLSATTEGIDKPQVVFLGALGRRGDDNWVRIAPFVGEPKHRHGWAASVTPSATFTAGGALPSGPGGQAIAAWWNGLDRRQRRLVTRRLVSKEDRDSRDLPDPDMSAAELFEHISVLYGAATPLDAESWYRSDVVFMVDPKEIPMLTVIPWQTPDREVGWLIVMPAYSGQIPPNARTMGLVRREK